MPFLIGLLSPVFTQRMSPFNSLLLPLATAQPVLMRHRGHQVDKHVIDGGARRIRKKSYAKVFRASVRAETSRLPVCGSAARRNRRLG